MPDFHQPEPERTPTQTPQNHIAEAWETMRINALKLPTPERVRAYAEIIRRLTVQIAAATHGAAVFLAVTAFATTADARPRRHWYQPPPPQFHPAPPTTPSPPPPENETHARTRAATVAVLQAHASGTGTNIDDPDDPNRDYVVTANHVVDRTNEPVTITDAEGRKSRGRVIARDKDADLALIQVEPPRPNRTVATIAAAPKPIGTAIYHHAHGMHRPQNLETGTVRTTYRTDGQDTFTLSVSAGDSGGGIFDAETGELVAVIAATTAKNRDAIVFAGNALRIHQLTKEH